MLKPQRLQPGHFSKVRLKDNIRSIPGLDGWRYCHFDSVGSTNTIASELAHDGDPGQVWITAGEQTAGKARRGRGWVSKPGNLYASLLLIDPAPAEQLGTLPLVASLALHRAVCDVVAGGRPDIAAAITIKWPNDILFDGKKLSGILLEAAYDTHGRLIVVLGFGVNCNHFPDNPLYPATSLADRGFNVSAEELFFALSRRLATELTLWAQGAGFHLCRSEWLERASGRGKKIIARLSDRNIEGYFETVDESGLMILRQDDGTRCEISSADIFFGDLAESKV